MRGVDASLSVAGSGAAPMRVLVLTGAAAWRLPVPGRQRTIDHRRSRPRMGADWRPETVDPLGKAMGEAFGVSQFERTQELWLDLRTSENTFAQM